MSSSSNTSCNNNNLNETGEGSIQSVPQQQPDSMFFEEGEPITVFHFKTVLFDPVPQPEGETSTNDVEFSVKLDVDKLATLTVDEFFKVQCKSTLSKIIGKAGASRRLNDAEVHGFDEMDQQTKDIVAPTMKLLTVFQIFKKVSSPRIILILVFIDLLPQILLRFTRLSFDYITHL